MHNIHTTNSIALHRRMMAGACMAAVLTLLLGACSTDDGYDAPAQERELTLLPVTQRYTDVQTEPTRSFTVNGFEYDEYSGADTRIRTYITRDARVDFYGDFVYSDGAWKSKVPLDDGTYYIYGFLPSSYASKSRISPLGVTNAGTGETEKDYANGAVLTQTAIPTLTTDDPCVVVGVKGTTSNAGNIAEIGMQRGNFTYMANEGNNYAYLLIDHLYANLHFTLKIDSAYNQLRTIRVRSFKLKGLTYGTATMTATLTAGSSGTVPISFAGQTGETEQLELNEQNDGTLLSHRQGEELHFSICAAPMTSSDTDFQLEFNYDVYDRYDHLIRQGETAINTIRISRGSLRPGERYTVKVTVVPTYLNVLSDPDLDNPRLKIGA